MSRDMVPDGGGFQDAIKSLITPGNIGKVAKEATKWVEEVIQLVKTAPDNPHKTDEEIAGVILDKIEEKKDALHKPDIINGKRNGRKPFLNPTQPN